MTFYQYQGFCLCPLGGRVPPEALAVDAPFSPLVFLRQQEAKNHRGIFAVHSLAELEETETAALLQSVASQEQTALEQLVEEHGASVLNTAFAHAFACLQTVCAAKKKALRVHLVGLGDVGGTALMGLTLLGKEIAQIGIYDPNVAQVQRYLLEMNQILPEQDGETRPVVQAVTLENLFACDCLLFTASLGVPPVGSRVADVRMAQYERNRKMLAEYAKMARKQNFSGLFCQISDPVDLLAREVFLASNRDESGRFDAAGLLPEQVIGFGLGVIAARAAFCAKQAGVEFSNGRVFGPHGQGLIVANDPDAHYDEAVSQMLTEQTATANLQVRALGFKPYLAPGLSSAAISVLRALRGQWFYGTAPIGGAYFGCELRLTRKGMELHRQALAPQLLHRLEQARRRLREQSHEG